jgi:hypothetical protein
MVYPCEFLEHRAVVGGIIAGDMTEFMRNANSVQYLVQCATESFSVMGIVEFRKPKQRASAVPRQGTVFLDPMTCNSKITICVAGLPRIAGDIDGPMNFVTLKIPIR